MTRLVLCWAALLVLLSGCGDSTSPNAADQRLDQYIADPDAQTLPPAVFGAALQPWHGDMQAMVERRLIRVLVSYSQTHYFLDGLTPRGMTVDSLKAFETFLTKKLKLKRGSLTLLPIPVARDQLVEFLALGLGDLAIGNLTITPERLSAADFSLPITSGVSEIVVTGPAAGPLESLDDLSGREIFVRASSSFHESLQALNADLASRDLQPAIIIAANENLQTEDILELVGAGVVDITVVDNHLAAFWASVLPDIRVHDNLTLSTDQQIAWAIRKDAAGLQAYVDEFIERNRKGTLLGNMLYTRYLQENAYIHNAAASEDHQRLLAISDLFRHYSAQYSFDWLLIAAQAYQESRLINSTRSPAGAVGVMQMLPTTARGPAVAIDNVEELENNIHAGHKYLRHLIDHYFADPEISEFNKELFAFAAYNAGPTRIKRLRSQAAARGLDPNIWFGNVELLVAEKVGREPVQYVRNILKYYTTYSLLRDRQQLLAPPGVSAQ